VHRGVEIFLRLQAVYHTHGWALVAMIAAVSQYTLRFPIVRGSVAVYCIMRSEGDEDVSGRCMDE
jgi:hypothetical protein